MNGNPEVLELLESALDGGRYDLVFADAGQHAYSIIKREQPDLVVLAVKIDEMEGFQLLSMLKLDPDTRKLPVVTYTSDTSDSDGRRRRVRGQRIRLRAAGTAPPALTRRRGTRRNPPRRAAKQTVL